MNLMSQIYVLSNIETTILLCTAGIKYYDNAFKGRSFPQIWCRKISRTNTIVTQKLGPFYQLLYRRDIIIYVFTNITGTMKLYIR